MEKTCTENDVKKAYKKVSPVDVETLKTARSLARIGITSGQEVGVYVRAWRLLISL